MDAKPLRRRRARSSDLDPYLGDIGSIPIPDQAEVVALVGVLRDPAATDAQKLDARNRLVEGNLRLVVAVARHHRDRGLDLADLIAAGNFGLLRAVKDYDPDRATFSTYAYHWIRAAVRHAIAGQGRRLRLPSYLHQLVARYHRALPPLVARLGRRPTADEMRAELGVSSHKWQRLTEALAVDVVEGLHDATPLSRDESPEDAAARAEDIARLPAILRRLPAREAEVLYRYYGLGESFADMGRDMGMSRERVRQIAALALLTAQAAAQGRPVAPVRSAWRRRRCDRRAAAIARPAPGG